MIKRMEIQEKIIETIQTLQKAMGVSTYRLSKDSGVSMRNLQYLNSKKNQALRVDTVEKILNVFGYGLSIALKEERKS